MKVGAVCMTADGLGAGYTGGAENQVGLLLSHLAQRGHEVTLVVPGLQVAPSIKHGVHVVSGWDANRGRRGMRAFTYRLPHLRRALRDVAADVYYARGFSHVAPSLVTAARSVGACSLLGLASDADLRLTGLAVGGSARDMYERLLYSQAASLYYREAGLRRATCVVAQTQGQLDRCQALRLGARRVANIVETPPAQTGECDDAADVIWVGSLSRLKGVEELANLVHALADISFDIVGPVRRCVAPRALDRLLTANNVTYHGELPHDVAWNRMRRARLLINTSPMEGFSNVMLEAWAVGTPAVSLAANPDSLLSGHDSLGLCAGGSLADMAAMIRTALADDAALSAAGQRAVDYVRRAHSPDVVCEQFESLVGESIDSGRPGVKKRKRRRP